MIAVHRLSLRPVPTPAVVVLGTLAFAATVAGAVLLEAPGLLHVGFGLLALAGIAYMAVFTPPGVLIAMGLGSTVFSGFASELGLPIGLDRILMVAGLGSLGAGLPGAVRERRIVWRPVHLLLALTAMYAVVSAIGAGTFTDQEGLFALLDRLGIVPFVVFTLAPLLFGTRHLRDALLTVLTCVGAYLGITAMAEALGLDFLVFPKYILDPDVGIHFGRARGPFVEAVANGIALYGCAVAAAVAAYTWTHRPTARVLAGLVTALCILGTIFTLTRAVWAGTVLATVIALLVNYRTRRILAPAVAFGAAALFAALVLVAGFGERAEERSGDQRPLWDRYNTNAAALRAVRDEPLFGIGWQRWRSDSEEYLHLSQEYPLTGAEIEVHNVPLSHAAELGLVGLALWSASMITGIGGAILRPGPLELDPWRLGLVAISIAWVVAAAFGPLSYAFPNLLLWTWAGVCSIGHLSERLDAR